MTRQLETVDVQADFHVGNIPNTKWHFIAVSSELYEPVKGVAGKRLHAIKFEREDIPWLIKALQKELILAKKRKDD